MKRISLVMNSYVVSHRYLQFALFGVVATVQALDRLVQVDSAFLTVLQFSPVLKWHNWLRRCSDYLLTRIATDFSWENWFTLRTLVVQVTMSLVELLPLQHATIFVHLWSTSSAEFVVVVARISWCQESNSWLRTWILSVIVVAPHGIMSWIASRREWNDRYVVLLGTTLTSIPESMTLSFDLHLRRKSIRLLQINKFIRALDALWLHSGHNWWLHSVNMRVFFLTWLHEVAPSAPSQR